MKQISAALFAVFMLGACSETVPVETPDAHALPSDAVGYFCGMIVENHNGPKGQIFIEGDPVPRWFTSVRDTLAYTRLPEETAPIAAIYVSDMARAESWDQPGDDAWMPAVQAYYVLGSSRMGGMGAAEAVPFSDEQAARDFVADFGGTIMRLHDIPDDQLLGSEMDDPMERMNHGTE